MGFRVVLVILHFFSLPTNGYLTQANYRSISPSSSDLKSIQFNSRSFHNLRATNSLSIQDSSKFLNNICNYNWNRLSDMWDTLAELIPNETMLTDNIHSSSATTLTENTNITYAEFQSLISYGSRAFQKLDVKPNDCVAIFSENSYRWLVTEQAIMKAGAFNAVRGASAPIAEVEYILQNSQAKALVVETPKLLQQLYSDLNHNIANFNLSFVVILWSNGESGDTIRETLIKEGIRFPPHLKLLSYEEMITLGKLQSSIQRHLYPNGDQVATVIYTSGTTAQPKGVMLTHRSLIHQIKYSSFSTQPNNNPYDPRVGEVFLSILPCWHIFERTAEYFCFSRGIRMIYSNLRNFKSDIANHRPHYLIAVPRLYETIVKGIQSNMKQQPPSRQKLINVMTKISTAYKTCQALARDLYIHEDDNKPVKKGTNLTLSFIQKLSLRIVSIGLMMLLFPLHKLADLLIWKKIRAGLGGRLKVLVSGGSSCPSAVEKSMNLFGLNLISGYGLSETSPTIANRKVERNYLGTVGEIMKDTSIQLKPADDHHGKPIEDDNEGVLWVKGPGVMKGYLNDDDATREAFDNKGYFNTGDLAKIVSSNGIFDQSKHLMITGRAKDTIVLLNGENISPTKIEEKILAASNLIDQVMVVGQDQRFLGAIYVLNIPEATKRGLLSQEMNLDINEALKTNDKTSFKRISAILSQNDQIKKSIQNDLEKIWLLLPGWERVTASIITIEPFSIANDQLTQTMKIKRKAVNLAYNAEIKQLFSKKTM